MGGMMPEGGGGGIPHRRPDAGGARQVLFTIHGALCGFTPQEAALRHPPGGVGQTRDECMAATLMEISAFGAVPGYAGALTPPRRLIADHDALPVLARQCAAALRVFGVSLSALDEVLQRLAPVDPHGPQAAAARATVREVVGLLKREGPALLLHAQALRLRLHAAGLVGPDGLGEGLRALQLQIGGLDDVTALDPAAHQPPGLLCASHQVARELADGFEDIVALGAG